MRFSGLELGAGFSRGPPSKAGTPRIVGRWSDCPPSGMTGDADRSGVVAGAVLGVAGVGVAGPTGAGTFTGALEAGAPVDGVYGAAPAGVGAKVEGDCVDGVVVAGGWLMSAGPGRGVVETGAAAAQEEQPDDGATLDTPQEEQPPLYVAHPPLGHVEQPPLGHVEHAGAAYVAHPPHEE